MLAAIAAFSMASCSQDIDLSGEWTVVKINGEAVDSETATPFLNFDPESGRIHGNTGVNILNGSYELDGSKLKLEGMGMTMMAGPENDMQIEQNFLSAVDNVAAVKRGKDGNVLLCDGKGDVLMELARK